MRNIKIQIFFILFSINIFAQTAEEKEINHQMQTWVSLNTHTKYNDHWAVIADVHMRYNDFFKENNFYLFRGGVSYIPNSKISYAGGYAHMWLAPSNPEWVTYSDENRIYQQVQINSKSGKVGISQRIRNEQRWQEKTQNNEFTGDIRFTNRIRYLASFNIPVFKNTKAPTLVFAEEIMLHFGKEVVYNTFEQNRIFIGIKQSVNKKLSFDFGYMNVYQQKFSGYQYDMNHTLRLFFYLVN